MASPWLLNRVRRGIAEMLRPDEQRPAPRPPQGQWPPQPACDRGFEGEFRAILAQAGTSPLRAGQVDLIGLDRIKERLGDNGERIARRADRIARNAIERHLAPGDIFTVWRDHSYVIVFATLDQNQAQVTCTLIAQAIARTLVREDSAHAIKVETAVSTVAGGIECAQAPSLDDLMKLVTKERSTPAETPPSAERPTSTAKEKLEVVPLADAPRPKASAVDRVRVVYRPVWDMAHGVISTYLTAPLLLTAKGEVYGNPQRTLLDDEELAQVDEAVRDAAIAELVRVVREKRQLLLMLTVHFTTLTRAAQRQQYTEPLKERLPLDARRLLVIEISGVPNGVQLSRLAELTRVLRPFCRAICAKIGVDTAQMQDLKAAGIAAVGFEIGNDAVTDFVLMQQMARFSRMAANAGIQSFVRGVRSLSLAAAALGAGFAYVDGDAVAKPVARPGDIVDFRLEDLYRTLLRS